MTLAPYLLFAMLFLACALCDFLFLRIPNTLVAALFAGWVAAVAWAIVGEPTIGVRYLLLAHLLPGVVVFALGAVLFHYNKLGGGDVKLLSVAVLWVGVSELGLFLIALGLGGFLLYLAHLRLRLPMLWLWTATRDAVGFKGEGPKALSATGHLPYGIAIATAALVVTADLRLLALGG